MSWQMAIFTYINLWCVLFFIALPFGVKHPDTYEADHWPGAPKITGLKKKIVYTSIATAVLVAIAYWALNNGVVSLG